MQIISKKFINHRPQLKKYLVTFIALAVWSFLLWRTISVFGPSGTANDVTFNSDCAIPVLMSNDARPITIFNLYYYGADRWGGWPFLLTQIIRRATGFWWSDQRLFALLTVWLFIGVLAIAGLDRHGAPLLSALAFLMALCLHSESRFQIFELSQLYAWQTTALLLSWYSLRRFFESRCAGPATTPGWQRATWLSLTFWFSFLAIWSSNASLFFLIFLMHVEAGRAWLATSAESPGKRVLKTYAFGLTAILAAFFCEWALKWNYHRHALKHYGFDYSVSFKLDRGFLGEHLGKQWHLITKLSWWPLYLLPTLALIALVAVLIHASFRKKKALLEELRNALTDETLIVAIGAYGIALINFTLTILVDHVRLNYYDDRYLTLTYLFGPLSGLLTIFLLIKLAVKKSPRLGSLVQPTLSVMAFILLLIKFPAQGISPQYTFYKETALALAQKAPRGILLGGYWDTYVFTALQKDDAMTAVPLEGQEVRMPWTREMVRHAGQVIVGYNRSDPKGNDPPADHLEQYGASLRLVDPSWYQNGGYTFALYVNEAQ